MKEIQKAPIVKISKTKHYDYVEMVATKQRDADHEHYTKLIEQARKDGFSDAWRQQEKVNDG